MLQVASSNQVEIDRIQQEAVDFMLRVPRNGLLLPTGVGKTKTALMYLDKLRKGAVIITPANVRKVWPQEAAKFGIDVGLTTDYRSPGRTLLISYDTIKNCPELLDDYEVVILDEAKLLADTETVRFKSLSARLRTKERLSLLMGYPVENKLAETFVFSLITDKLGNNYYHFLYRFFTVIKKQNRIIKAIPKPDSLRRIVEALRDKVFIVDKSAVVPATIKKETIVVRFKLTDYQRNLINALSEFGEYRDELLHVTCKTPLVAFGKAMQIISGFVYRTNDNQELYPVYLPGGNPKLDKLSELIDGRDNFLLWFWFDSEQPLLDRFKSQCRISKIQTDNRGLNLQSYKFAVWFSVPLSGGMFLQGVDRIYRFGRTEDVVSIVLVPEGEFGDKLLTMLDAKARLTSKFIKSLLKVRV